MLKFYESNIFNLNAKYPLRFVVLNNERIVLAIFDEEYNEYIEFYNLKEANLFQISKPVIKSIRAAKRSELKRADLWKFVINKDDYSCIEDELEEYLRLGEEKEGEE